MKKIARIISSFVTVASLTLIPVTAVHAQVDPVEVGDSTTTTTTDTTIPTTGGTTPATPDTGIAPAENRVVANSLVFVGGSALGAALGLGYLAYRKKQQN